MSATPPIARKIPRTDIVHGDVRQDDYHWMREKDDPEVIAYLTAENAYTDAVMKPTVPFQESLYAEMLARIKEDDQSVPYRLRGYYYYSRTEKGKQYPIYCRKAGSLEAPEQVMLDLNRLAEGHPFLALGAAAVSDDGRRLAYTTDVTGFREYTLQVKDLETGALLPDRVEKVSAVAWAADNETIFYVTEDHAKRPYRLHRHRLGVAVADLLHEEPDALFRFHVGRSRSQAYLFLISGSFTTTEVRYLAAGDPGGAWRMVLPREPDHEYQVDHGHGPDGDLFYIRTNGGGQRNFRLVAAPVDDPHPARWRELIPHRPDVMLEDVDVFARHYVVHEREDGLIRLRVTEAGTGAYHHVEFPEPTYDVSSDANAEFDDRDLSAALPVAHHARLGVRLRHRGAPPAPAQAVGGAGRLRPRAVHLRARPRDGAATAPASRSRSCAARGRAWTARARCCSRATEPTAIPTRPDSRRTGSACSTAGSAWRSPTSAAGASWASAGTTRAA